MVEEAAVLVIDDEQRRLAPDVGIGHEGLEDSGTRFSPYSGGAAGCSHWASGGMIHDTAGRVPAATSAWNDAG